MKRSEDQAAAQGSTTGEPEAPTHQNDDLVGTTEALAKKIGGQLGIQSTLVDIDLSARGAREAQHHGSSAVVTGNRINLDAKKFDPKTRHGKRKLGHEMAHVAQKQLPGAESLELAEREANLFANAFVAGRNPPKITTPVAFEDNPTWLPDGETASQHPDQQQISLNGFVVEPPYIRVEKLWYDRHFGESTVNATVTAGILDELTKHPGYEHIRNLSAEMRAQANANIALHRPSTWEQGNIVRVPIYSDVYQWIGLPPGDAYLWHFPATRSTNDDEAQRFTARCIIQFRSLGEVGTQHRASPELMEQILASLESDTGLTMDPSVREDLVANGFFINGLTRNIPAISFPLSRDDMIRFFGEQQWSRYENRRVNGDAAPAGQPSEGGVQIDQNLPAADREFAERFLRELYGTADDSDGGSLTMYVGATLIAVWQEIDRQDPSTRAEIMEKLRGRKSMDPDDVEARRFERPLSEIDRFRLAIQAVKLDQEYDRLGIETSDRQNAERRPFDFPVEGYIQNHTDLLFPGKEGVFSFVTTTRRDAFAIPWVDVNWVVRSASSPDSSGNVIDRGHTSHRDYATEAPDRYDVDFDEIGIYEVNALVDHRFYVPSTFRIYVEVKRERERMQEMSDRTFGEAVFDVLDPDNSLREQVVEGELGPQECLPGQAEHELLPGDVEAIEAQAQRIRNYVTSANADPNMIGPAREYLEGLEKTLRKIRKEQNAGALMLMIGAAYLSRSDRATSHSLTLVATALKRGSSWRISIHDTTQAFDNRNSEFEEDGSTFREALNEAVDNLAETYPTGTMNVRVQTLDDEGNETGRFVSYTIDTNSTWESVKTTVWDPAVQIAVNIAGAVVVIFAPPTGAVIIPALVAYNAVEVIDRLSAYHERDALETEDIALGISEIAIDLLPFVGRASKLVRIGSKSYYVLEGVELAGDIALMTANAMEQMQSIQFGAVRQAAELQAQIQQLEARNPSDPRLPVLRDQFERAQDTTRQQFSVFAQTVATQGVMRGSMRTLSHVQQFRTRRLGQSRAHLNEAAARRGNEPIRGEDAEHLQRVHGIPLVSGGSGADVKIRFDVGAHGGITNMRLEVGPDASLSMVRAHDATIAAMRRYEGVAGSLRNLLDRVRAFVHGNGHIPTQSRAFEARFELQKLPEIVQRFRDQLEAGNLDASTVAEINRQISILDAQIHQHAQHLNDLTPGLGFVAARGDSGEGVFAMMGQRPDQRTTLDSSQIDVPTSQIDIPADRASTPRHQELLRLRGNADLTLANRPEGWTGHMEAEFRYGAAAVTNPPQGALPEGYHWTISQSGHPTVVRSRANNDDGTARSRKRYVGDGVFEDVADGVNRADRTVIENEFNVSDDVVRAEFDQIIANRETARTDRNRTEGEFQVLADQMGLTADQASNIDDTILALRARHAGDADMLSRIDALEAKRRELAGHRRSVVQHSERLGDRMAEEYVKANYPGAELIYGGPSAQSRSGDFDQLWLVPRDPPQRSLILIVEAKGGGSQLGTRGVDGRREQQGTRRYMRAIADLMAARPDLPPETLRAVNDILLHGGVDDRPEVQYILVQAPLGTSQGQVVARPGRVSEFDISNEASQ